MSKVRIYGVCGALGFENIYVFQGSEPVGMGFDEFEVELPEGYRACKTVTGEMIIETPNDYQLTLEDAFKPGTAPILYGVNNAGYPIKQTVKFEKINEKQRYDASYL